MSIVHRLVVVLGLIIILCVGIAASAQACCVYNHTNYTTKVCLSCGVACMNSWYISSDGKKCRPGKGGKVEVAVLGSNSGYLGDPCKVKVDNHGWVSISKSGRKFVVKSKRKSGSVKEKCIIKRY